MRESLAHEAARLLKVQTLTAADPARVTQLAAAAAGLLDGRTRIEGDAGPGAMAGAPASALRGALPTGASRRPEAAGIALASGVPTKVSWLRRMFGRQR